MPEFYTNTASTTVSASYAPAAGTLTCGTTGGGFPTNPSFRLVVTDQTTSNPKVIFKVTGIPSSTTFLVTAEGTDVACSSGDSVWGIISKGALDQVRADITQVGSYSALPGTSTASKGDTFESLNAPYRFVFDGSIWQPFDSPLIFPAVNTASFTMTQGTADTVTTTDRDVVFVVNSNAGAAVDRVHNYGYANTASTSYTLTVQFVPQWNGVSFIGWGPNINDGTKMISFEYYNNLAFQITTWSNYTSGSGEGNVFSTTSIFSSPANIYMRIVDNGTNRSYQYSLNGVEFQTLLTHTNTTLLTGHNVGFGAEVIGNAGSVRGQARIRGFSLTSP